MAGFIAGKGLISILPLLVELLFFDLFYVLLLKKAKNKRSPRTDML